MTLTITVVTPRCIYQSADFRLLDWTARTTRDFETQKIVLVNTFTWSATVCFAGVGRSGGLNVGDWLAERTASIQGDDPFPRLLDELLKADEWLQNVPAPHNRHSFSVGAFVGSKPVFALVSNYERLQGLALDVPSPRLAVFQVRPTKPKTFISGQPDVVGRPERRRLAALAACDPKPEAMYAELAMVNRGVAKRRSILVSRACFTTHVRLTGEGGGRAHDVENRPYVPGFVIPEAFKESIRELLEKEFGLGRYQLVGMSSVRADASDEYHSTQLREKPQDANTHCNYGVFLEQVKKDREGAEREYRRAIELDSNHVNALGNLANTLWHRGEVDGAARLYVRALEAGPEHENVTSNYARFLHAQRNDHEGAREVLDRGIKVNPESARLLLLRAQLNLLAGKAAEAIEDFRRARTKGADQTAVEAGYACALHLNGGSVGECIAAYRVATTLDPSNASLWLNLAQLLFMKGEDEEASRRLHDALRLGLDESAQLEAQFYLLAHTPSDPAPVIEAIKLLLTAGARLAWKVQPSIEAVRRHHPEKAVLLELLSEVMAGKRDQALLDQVVVGWPGTLEETR